MLAIEVVRIDGRQRRQPRSDNVLARMFVRFTNVDQHSFAAIEFLL
jgi:hypothetical protein